MVVSGWLWGGMSMKLLLFTPYSSLVDFKKSHVHTLLGAVPDVSQVGFCVPPPLPTPEFGCSAAGSSLQVLTLLLLTVSGSHHCFFFSFACVFSFFLSFFFFKFALCLKRLFQNHGSPPGSWIGATRKWRCMQTPGDKLYKRGRESVDPILISSSFGWQFWEESEGLPHLTEVPSGMHLQLPAETILITYPLIEFSLVLPPSATAASPTPPPHSCFLGSPLK